MLTFANIFHYEDPKVTRLFPETNTVNGVILMQRQRDELGRFVIGNTVAVGNKGNCYAKYGNKNAKKHGLFEKVLHGQEIVGDDLILYAFHKGIAIRFYKGEWQDHGDGFTIFGDKAERAASLLGMQFKRVKVKV